MLLIPLKLENVRFRPGLVSGAVAVLLIYQAVLAQYFHGLQIDAALFAQLSCLDLEFWKYTFLGLFRGQGLFSLLFIMLLWILFGQALEQRIGSSWMALAFLGGSMIPIVAAKFGVIALEKYWWPGLGGTLFLLGLCYALMWEEDVEFFYFVVAPPAKIDWGRSSVGAFIPLIFIHLVICAGQIVYYLKSKGEAPPPGVPTATWGLVYPVVVMLVCLAASAITRLIKRSTAGGKIHPSSS